MAQDVAERSATSDATGYRYCRRRHRRVVFPPSIVVGAVTGGVAGGVLARMNRSLDKGDIKRLGTVMSSGEIALVVLTTEESVETLDKLLEGATDKVTQASSTAEEVQEALIVDGAAKPKT